LPGTIVTRDSSVCGSSEHTLPIAPEFEVRIARLSQSAGVRRWSFLFPGCRQPSWLRLT